MATFVNVRFNQLTPAATAWLAQVLQALNAKDIGAYTAFMADDVEVTFNNGDLNMRGPYAVRDGITKFWQGFDTFEHDELNIYGTDRNLVPEALNYRTITDGREVTIRAVAWIDRNEAGEVTSLRVYNDQSLLWAQI